MPVSWRQDLSIKELGPVKLLLFLQSAGDMALYPFFTLHMKSLGISLSEIGLQFAVTPVATLIATPLVGLIADRMGDFKKMLAACLVICAIMANFILLVPKITTVSQCELYDDSIKLTCPWQDDEPFEMIVPDCFERTDSRSIMNRSRVELLGTQLNFLAFSDCYIDCYPQHSNRIRKYCLREKGVSSPNLEECYSFHGDADEDQGKHRRPKHMLTVGITVEKRAFANAGLNGTSVVKANFHEAVADLKYYSSIKCRSHDCEIKCPIKPTTRLSENLRQRHVVDPAARSRTFWYYLVLRISLIVVIATEMSLLKAAILALVDKNDSEYGFQRLWSLIAICIVPPIVGVVMDRLKASGDPDAFYPCFYVYAGFKVFMAAVALAIDLNAKAPSLEIWKRVVDLARNREAAVLLFFVTVLGTIWAFVDTFTAWYLEQLKASRTVIGLTFTISAICGIPFTIGAGWLERKVGAVPLLVIGLLAYTIRLLGYSYAKSAVTVLFLETLEGITTSLVVVIITTYSSVLATKDLLATMQATWAALHFAVGRAIGSAVGGYLMENFGTAFTYRTFSILAFVSACAYLAVYLRWFRSAQLERQQQLKKESELKAANGEHGSELSTVAIRSDIEIAAQKRPKVAGAEGNQIQNDPPPSTLVGIDNRALTLDKDE